MCHWINSFDTCDICVSTNRYCFMTVGILHSIHGSHKSKSDTQSATFIHKKKTSHGEENTETAEKKKKRQQSFSKPSCNDLQGVFQAQNKSCYLGDNLRTPLSWHPKYSIAAALHQEKQRSMTRLVGPNGTKKKIKIPVPRICPGVSSNPTRFTNLPLVLSRKTSC